MGNDIYMRRCRFGSHGMYNVFDCIRILNTSQAAFYMDNDIDPVDIKVSRDKKTNKAILVFYFIKDETKDIYKRWCEQNEISRN